MAEGCECCWIISEGNLLFKEYMWNLVRIYHVKIWKEAGWNNKYLTRPYLFLCVIVRTNWGRQAKYIWLIRKRIHNTVRVLLLRWCGSFPGAGESWGSGLDRNTENEIEFPSDEKRNGKDLKSSLGNMFLEDIVKQTCTFLSQCSAMEAQVVNLISPAFVLSIILLVDYAETIWLVQSFPLSSMTN